MIRNLTSFFLLLLVAGCATSSKGSNQEKLMAENDPYLWLEDVEGEKSLAWVRERNERTTSALEARADYKKLDKDIRRILLAKDRIPSVRYQGGWVYNFWQDDKNVRGLWRRMPLAMYTSKSDKWETLLDLDQLAKNENENWVWEHSMCLPPGDGRCLLSLSRGGKDASVIREFDISSRTFVNGGFEVPEAKSSVSWFDKDTVFVGTDFGPGSMSKSGYPRQVRIWKRGEPLSSAKMIFEATEADMAAGGWTSFSPHGTYRLVTRTVSFWESQTHLLKDDLTLSRIPFPDDANILGVHQNYAYASLRTDWKTAAHTFVAGSLVALDLDDLSAAPNLMFEPTEKIAIDGTIDTKSAVFVRLVDNVKGRAVRITRSGQTWKVEPTPFPSEGNLDLSSGDSFDDVIFASYESFLTPPAVLVGNARDGKLKIKRARALPARFNANDLISEQLEATSADGTKVPYFVVRHKNAKTDGSTPTVLYGYGGFEVSLTPYYLGSTGKIWAEKGGAWVVANIRGGGEFGPKWHQAALKENRQRAFDDFIAVGEDLVRRKITSPAKLAIMGGSNGGLLVGAALTQRPDLFRAVVCQVPLLDMLRYHKLLAGHSWTAEYGDPDDPKMAEIIRKYSPYQNVNQATTYPTVFFMTSTKDDRVHPGHARKMAARMEEFGHKFEYFENIEGGHGAAANLEQRIRFQALTYTFLRRELGLDAK